MLIEYLDSSASAADLPALREREQPASAGAETLPAWGEVAPTAIGAPSFDELGRHQVDIDVEVDRFVEGALVEQRVEQRVEPREQSVDIDIDVEEPRDSLEIDLHLLEPRADDAAPLELVIDIDFVTDEERLRLDVAIAHNSDSHIWEGLDGEYGVFLATYQTLPIGTQVELTVHLLDQSFEAPATVRWVRAENTGVWPGLGLELDLLTEDIARTIERFGRVRPAMFHCY